MYRKPIGANVLAAKQSDDTDFCNVILALSQDGWGSREVRDPYANDRDSELIRVFGKT